MGHTHNDQFFTVRSEVDGRPLGAIYAVPSMTTFVDLKPSFRIYEVDQDSLEIVDYVQYRLDMDKANMDKTKLSWDFAYSFKQEYNLTSLAP